MLIIMIGIEDTTIIKQRWFCLPGTYSLEGKTDNRPVNCGECLALSQLDGRSYVGQPGDIWRSSRHATTNPVVVLGPIFYSWEMIDVSENWTRRWLHGQVRLRTEQRMGERSLTSGWSFNRQYISCCQERSSAVGNKEENWALPRLALCCGSNADDGDFLVHK